MNVMKNFSLDIPLVKEVIDIVPDKGVVVQVFDNLVEVEIVIEHLVLEKASVIIVALYTLLKIEQRRSLGKLFQMTSLQLHQCLKNY